MRADGSRLDSDRFELRASNSAAAAVSIDVSRASSIEVSTWGETSAAVY